jgi:alpha-1,6-mannosyltransferase
MKTSVKITSILLVLSLCGMFILPAIHLQTIVAYTVTAVSSSLIFIVFSLLILKEDVPPRYFYGFLAVGILLRLAFVFVHPVGSPDYYRYVWDGKVQAHGINPYRYAPDDPALDGLHSDLLPARVTYPEMRTIYPPLSETLFYCAYLISGESFLGIKLLILIFDIATMLGIFLTLKVLRIDRKHLLIYALCPLPLIQFFLDGHADGFGFAFLIFAMYFYFGDKKTITFIFVGLSMLVKPLALIVVPVLFFAEKDTANRLKAAAIPLLLFGLAYVPYIFTGYPFQALMKFTENWTFNGVIFDILDSFIRDNQRARIVCAILLAIAYLPVLLSRRDLLTKIYVSIFLLFLFSPIVHPWYIGWLAVLLPLVPRPSGIAYVGLSSLTAFTVLTYQQTGVWNDYTLVLIFEYAPVILLFLWEMLRRREVLPVR